MCVGVTFVEAKELWVFSLFVLLVSSHLYFFVVCSSKWIEELCDGLAQWIL
jgi:hypothetical protein